VCAACLLCLQAIHAIGEQRKLLQTQPTQAADLAGLEGGYDWEGLQQQDEQQQEDEKLEQQQDEQEQQEDVDESQQQDDEEEQQAASAAAAAAAAAAAGARGVMGQSSPSAMSRSGGTAGVTKLIGPAFLGHQQRRV
jgi:hypothetical protein